MIFSSRMELARERERSCKQTWSLSLNRTSNRYVCIHVTCSGSETSTCEHVMKKLPKHEVSVVLLSENVTTLSQHSCFNKCGRIFFHNSIHGFQSSFFHLQFSCGCSASLVVPGLSSICQFFHLFRCKGSLLMCINPKMRVRCVINLSQMPHVI